MLNILKSSTKGYAGIVEDLNKFLSCVGGTEDWGKINTCFQSILIKILASNYDLSKEQDTGCLDLFTDWSAQGGGVVLMENNCSLFLGSFKNDVLVAASSSFLGDAKTIVAALKQTRWLTKGRRLKISTDSEA